MSSEKEDLNIKLRAINDKFDEVERQFDTYDRIIEEKDKRV